MVVRSYKLYIVSNIWAFKIAIKEICKQASRDMIALLCKCRKFDLPVDIRLELFDRLVTPVMVVCMESIGV